MILKMLVARSDGIWRCLAVDNLSEGRSTQRSRIGYFILVSDTTHVEC